MKTILLISAICPKDPNDKMRRRTIAKDTFVELDDSDAARLIQAGQAIDGTGLSAAAADDFRAKKAAAEVNKQIVNLKMPTPEQAKSFAQANTKGRTQTVVVQAQPTATPPASDVFSEGDLAEMLQDNEQLQAQNQRLAAEIEQLKSGNSDPGADPVTDDGKPPKKTK